MSEVMLTLMDRATDCAPSSEHGSAEVQELPWPTGDATSVTVLGAVGVAPAGGISTIAIDAAVVNTTLTMRLPTPAPCTVRMVVGEPQLRWSSEYLASATLS